MAQVLPELQGGDLGSCVCKLQQDCGCEAPDGLVHEIGRTELAATLHL